MREFRALSRAPTEAHQAHDADHLHRDHVKELNNTRPKQPFFFLKPPTTLLQPGEGPVIAPKGVNLHYEIELALIMGKRVTDLDASDEKGAIDAIDSESSITTAAACCRVYNSHTEHISQATRLLST